MRALTHAHMRALTHAHTHKTHTTQLKLLFQTERRSGGYWHVNRPKWERRLAAGGAATVPEVAHAQVRG